MYHFDQLILDVVGFGHAIVIGGKGSCTDQYIPDSDFTPSVRLTVISGETLYHHSGKFIFPTHKHPFIGNKHVIENNQCFVPTILCISEVHIGIFLHFTGITGLTAVHHKYAFGI